MVARTDWVIGLGPDAGHGRGRIVYPGPPADLTANSDPFPGQDKIGAWK